jgi:hypothetical protein
MVRQIVPVDIHMEIVGAKQKPEGKGIKKEFFEIIDKRCSVH